MKKKMPTEGQHLSMASKLDSPLGVHRCEARGSGCESHFLGDGSCEPVCRTCRRGAALATCKAQQAQAHRRGCELRACEEGGDACQFYLFTKRGTPDAVCEGCRNEHAALRDTPEQGARANSATRLLPRTRVGRRLLQGLVTRFGKEDGHAFCTTVETCPQCRGFGYETTAHELA